MASLFLVYARVLSIICFSNPQNVVKQSVKGFVDDSHMDGKLFEHSQLLFSVFLANCDCRYESRNTILLKVLFLIL